MRAITLALSLLLLSGAARVLAQPKASANPNTLPAAPETNPHAAGAPKSVAPAAPAAAAVPSRPAAKGAAAPTAATAAPGQPAAATAAPEAATPPATAAEAASAAPAAGAAEPAAAPATEPAAAAAPAPSAASRAEALRIARERAELRALLARQRARASTVEPEAEPVRRHSDAGAANAIGASFDAPWYLKPSYDVFSDKDVASRFGLWVARDVAAVRSDTFLAIELGWGTEHEKSGGLRADTLGSELTTHAFYGGAQVRFVPLSWLQPHARLAGGAELVSMSLSSSTPATTFKDHGWSPFASLGLGFTLRTPTRLFEDRGGHMASLSLGLMLEGGYTLAKPLDFALKGPAPDKRGIPIAEPQLGTLQRSGPYARASVVCRF